MKWIDFNNKYNQSCRDCEKRHVGCHSKCDSYKKEKELRVQETQGLIKEHNSQIIGIYAERGRKRRLF